jgi:hypothetical protein
MSKDLNCQTGLKPNIVDEETFDREMALCKKLSGKHDGKCGWGVCKDCGVVPLLIKLHKGQLLEDDNEIKLAKENITGDIGSRF